MSLWSWWKREPPAADDEEDEDDSYTPVSLPTEPFVHECRACGKVFESRRKHPTCPECESDDTEALA